MATSILGLSAYAQSGKDTAAAILVEQGWTRMAFGDAIRAFALGTVEWVKVRDKRVWWLAGYRPMRTVRLADLVARVGWEEAKKHPAVRSVLQDVGKKARDTFGDDAWTDAVMAAADATDGPVVITDVRFPAEAAAIRSRPSGRVVRIVRPGTGPINAHPSETALDNYDGFDAVVHNDSTPAELRTRILALAQHTPKESP